MPLGLLRRKPCIEEVELGRLGAEEQLWEWAAACRGCLGGSQPACPAPAPPDGSQAGQRVSRRKETSRLEASSLGFWLVFVLLSSLPTQTSQVHLLLPNLLWEPTQRRGTKD